MSFKTFDFFQKVALDNVTKPTLIGSLLSISAISIMIFLFIRQLRDFYSYHTKTDSVVYQPNNADEQLSINMELLFNSVPCNLLSLDTVDIINNHRGDISDTIKKKKYYQSTGRFDQDYITNRNVEDLVRGVNANEGCAFVGKIRVNQVPGEFHISFHNYRNLWREFNQRNRDLVNKVKLSHSFKSLSLGDTPEKVVKRFELDPNLFFRNFIDINTFNDKEILNYNYFIKIIPYMLVDENWGSTYYTYSFSLSSKSTQFNPHYDEMPIVTIRYEFSPIMMKVTHLKRDYLHFLTHVSAIVGGVFVVFSIINRIATNFLYSSNN
jgi:hypothetical protein